MSTALADQLEEIAIAELKESLVRGPTNELFLTGNDEIDHQPGVTERGKITHSAPDKVTVYSMKDGTPSLILVYMLAKVIRRKLPNGKPAFTLRQSDAPSLGNAGLKCFLHEDSAWREEVISMGMGNELCQKTNLPSVWQQERHGQTKHKQAWAALEFKRTRSREDEDRELLKSQTAAMQRMATGGNAAAPAPTLGPSTTQPLSTDDMVHRCADCTRFFDAEQGLSMHRYKMHPTVKEGAA
jgi:hypothetical protein